MDIRAKELESYLSQLTISNQEMVDTASEGINSIKNQPDSLLIFLDVFVFSNRSDVRKASVANFYRMVKSDWDIYNDEIKETVKQRLLDILVMDIDENNLRILIDASSLIFKKCGLWNGIIQLVCTLYTSKQIPLTILILSSIFQVMSSDVIEEYWPAFRNMAYAGLKDMNIRIQFLSLDIFLHILKIAPDESVSAPMLSYFLDVLRNDGGIPKESMIDLWRYLRRFFKRSNIAENDFLDLYEIAIGFINNNKKDIELRGKIIHAFCPLIHRMNDEMIELIFSITIELSHEYISQHEQLPMDFMSFVDGSLSTKPSFSSEIIKKKVFSLVSEEETSCVLGVYLLSSLLHFSARCLSEDYQFLQNTLQNALDSNSFLLVEAALHVIDSFSECPSVVSCISVPLLSKVIDFLVHENTDIKTLAYNAFTSLCEVCDTEIQGLFPAVWKLHSDGMIEEENMANYLVILSKVLSLSKDVEDQFIIDIIAFVEHILSSNMDMIIKSSALAIVSCLFELDDSISVDLLYRIQPTINDLLEDSNHDAVVQVLTLFRNIAISFRAAAVDFLKPYFSRISTYIGEIGTRIYACSMLTASTIVKFCRNNELLSDVCAACSSLIESEDEQLMTDACENISLISRGLQFKEEYSNEENDKNKERSKYFLRELIRVIDEEIESDTLGLAFEALHFVLRRCRKHDVDEFDSQCQGILLRTLNGEINFFAGSMPYETDTPVELIEYIMQFSNTFLSYSPSNSYEILQFIFSWMFAKPEFSHILFGILIDIVAYFPLDENLLISLTTFAHQVVSSKSDSMLQQNFSCFLSRAINSIPSFYMIAESFLPTIEEWIVQDNEIGTGYSEALSNIFSFLLSINHHGTLISSLKSFPPSDFKETQFMCNSILKLFTVDQEEHISHEAVFAISRFLTEPSTQRLKRKVSDDTFTQMAALFKSLVDKYPETREMLFVSSKSALKIETITNYLS